MMMLDENPNNLKLMKIFGFSLQRLVKPAFVFLFFISNFSFVYCQQIDYLNVGRKYRKIYNYYSGNQEEIDSFGNIYLAGTIRGTLNSADTIEFIKLDKEGNLIWKKNYLGSGLQCYLSGLTIYKNLIYATIQFNGQISIGDSAYYTSEDSIGFAESYGLILIKYDLQGNILTQKHIIEARGLNQISFKCLNENEIGLSCQFSDLVKFIPFSQKTIKISKPEELNFLYTEIDSSYIFKNTKYSIVKKNAALNYYGQPFKKLRFLSGGFICVNNDSLLFGNIKIGSNLGGQAPFLFLFDSLGNVTKSIVAFDSGPQPSNSGGYMAYSSEDNSGNIYLLTINFGQYQFAGATIGKINDMSQTLMKLNPQGQCIWQRTFATSGFFHFGGGVLLDNKRNKIWLRGMVQDTFSIGPYQFSEEFYASSRGFVAQLDTAGNVEDVKLLGYTSEASFSNFRYGLDSTGNFAGLLESRFPDPFQAGCFQMPTSPIPADSVRLFLFKIGPSTLKKDSLYRQYDVCKGQGQLDIRYNTQYPPLQYFWNGQPKDSAFSFSQGGSYQLIVKDATCFADTQYFNFPAKAVIANPTILGESQVNNLGLFLYHASFPDSLQINWEVTGGQLVSGQGSDSIFVNWPASGQGLVSFTLTGLQSGCQSRDSLQVLITGNVLAFKNISQTKIYPVPTDNYVTIITESNLKTSYNLTNILGEHVEAGEILKGLKELNLNNLEAGIYLLNISTAITNETFKVVKK